MKARFDKNGNVLLTVTAELELMFDTVSACLQYCRENDLDPVVSDCQFAKERRTA